MSFVQYLLDQQLIIEQHLELARNRKRKSNSTLLDALLDLNLIEEDHVCKVLSETLNISVLNLHEVKIDEKVVRIIPEHLARRYQALPLELTDNNGLTLAMSDPTNIIFLDELRCIIPYDIQPRLAPRTQILSKINDIYQGNALVAALEDTMSYSKMRLPLDDQQILSSCSYLTVERSPVVQLVNAVFNDAINEKVSDIHVEPMEESLEVRYRVDGVLQPKLVLPKSVQKHIISRIKIMAHLDISECRRPQDGRIQFSSQGRRVDARVSCIPTVFGEKVVLRILDAQKQQIYIGQLGFSKQDLDQFEHFTKQPQGMILVCGPTGSGKTSTLYGALNIIKSKEKNIMTIEDPVEYIIDGINQMQIDEKINVTFAGGLRSILRQDPDVILVGEIRDRETADIAFRASLTGHLVLSSLHTNCSISAITRLRDIGIDPFLISSSLLGVISQRLVRLNCPNCKQRYQPESKLIDKFAGFLNNVQGANFERSKGCPQCNFLGYKSRIGIFEVLKLGVELRKLVYQNASELEILKKAKEQGFKSMLESGMDKVLAGMTTLEELARVAGSYEKIQQQNPSKQNYQPELGSNIFDLDRLRRNIKGKKYSRKALSC